MMPGPNQLAGVRNGEPCPGCNTSIWGAQPKNCFVCGYDFANPDNPANLQGPATDEALLARQAEALMQTMDRQKEIEVSAKARIEQMATEYLTMNWPEIEEGDSTRPWTEAFLQAARQSWPEATFYDVETVVEYDSASDRWYKRIRGSMDLIQQRVVGFRFDYGLKREPGQVL